ncbi:cytochrome P450 [Aspergillus clavatus NRRL 1]|uniref:Cytochrome P450 alkane hydroxylase, putative n=1 Tax=Aspergillus clavatus (strain ATCC 1007 / CBS 513.65 / DSM 816 / NCTC 3887 / NRRL 1 / QM 1276 / 107) TaxID=344612 RepID=A1CSC5_ASPCL|nr:cytochrome P450 alkane hydroxylase, putative [Aspergillus clavatus NRRL 1]EAW08546.1 cytochrome P450 alkane hydroxylase, putative [Aspergillus clavatus NRRL 1]
MASHRFSLLLVAVLLAVYILSVLHRKWTQYRFARAHGCQPPVRLPLKDPFFGLDLMLQAIRNSREHKSLERTVRRFDTYGNTIATRRFATRMIFTREPQNVKTVLSLRFRDYGLGRRINTFGPLLGHGIFTTDGDHWAQSRAMIRPNFVREQVADLHVFESLLVDFLALIPADAATVDLQDLFFSYTIDSATEFLFGHSVQSLKKRRAGGRDAGSEDDFAAAFNCAQQAIVNGNRLGPLRFLFPDRRAEAARRVCHALVEQFVDKALAVRATPDEEKAQPPAAEKKRYVFLDGLAQQTGDRRRIRDELMNVLLAGRDTTASLLSNLFFMLAKHPRVWARLRAEIATLDGRPPTYEQLRALTYVKYCLNESLRIHPVVPGNARFANTDTVLPLGGGPDGQAPVFVAKGTVVVYSPFAMHRREEFYGPDAEEFRPERWADLRPGWEYLPFNGGPRICVGQQYALTEAGYVTVRLAQRFSVLESRDPGPWEESLALTLSSRNGVKVSLRE